MPSDCTVVKSGTPRIAGENIRPAIVTAIRTDLPRNSVRAKPYPAREATSSTMKVTQTDTTSELTNQLGMLPASKTFRQESRVKSLGIQCGDATDSAGVLSDVDRAHASGAIQITDRARATTVRAICAGVQVLWGLRRLGDGVVIGRCPPLGCGAATS